MGIIKWVIIFFVGCAILNMILTKLGIIIPEEDFGSVEKKPELPKPIILERKEIADCILKTYSTSYDGYYNSARNLTSVFLGNAIKTSEKLGKMVVIYDKIYEIGIDSRGPYIDIGDNESYAIGNGKSRKNLYRCYFSKENIEDAKAVNVGDEVMIFGQLVAGYKIIGFGTDDIDLISSRIAIRNGVLWDFAKKAILAQKGDGIYQVKNDVQH